MDKNTENKTIDELYRIATQTEADTFLSAIGKPYNENLISDYLAFILDKNRNGGLGVDPLNALLKSVKSGYKVDEKDDIIIEREHCLNGNQKNRIDFLIRINASKKTKFCIGIENKIFADERPNQTIDYANELHSNRYRGLKENIGIFLTPFEMLSADEKQNGTNAVFRSINYEELLDEFSKSIKEESLKDPEKKLYNDFIVHIKKYIVGDVFSENDCLLLKAGEYIEKEYKKLQSKERKMSKLYDLHIRLLALKNAFFKRIEKEISNTNDKWKIKIGNGYIQFFDKSWQESEIHYEIVITKNINRKGGIYAGIPLSLMIHAEPFVNKSNKIHKKGLQNILSGNECLKNYKTKSLQLQNKEQYKSPINVFECKIDTNNFFDSPNTIIENVRLLVGDLLRLKKSTAESINKYIDGLNN